MLVIIEVEDKIATTGFEENIFSLKMTEYDPANLSHNVYTKSINVYTKCIRRGTNQPVCFLMHTPGHKAPTGNIYVCDISLKINYGKIMNKYSNIFRDKLFTEAVSFSRTVTINKILK
jgi:hypothetical protein